MVNVIPQHLLRPVVSYPGKRSINTDFFLSKVGGLVARLSLIKIKLVEDSVYNTARWCSIFLTCWIARIDFMFQVKWSLFNGLYQKKKVIQQVMNDIFCAFFVSQNGTKL